MEKVAIIGAGPAGLAVGRYLLAHGFDPVIYEAHTQAGGQWDISNPMSGVWPQMRTNTARMVTRFSDLDYPDGTAIFPRNQEVGSYLRTYAEKMGLADLIRYETRLTGLEQAQDGWLLTLKTPSGARTETVPKVVIATGAYNKPTIPAISGLDEFSGKSGAIHAFNYKTPDAYRDKNVLIAGGNISSLEIAQDLAMLGAKSVATTMRRQRYVMPKLIAGVPVESYGFTREGAIWQENASSDEWAEGTKEFVLQYGGNPAWYGAPEPDKDVRIAGTTGSQNFLNLVAEDRIQCYPWIRCVQGKTVTFEDGRKIDFDGIIFGTGYNLNLPFLSDDLRDTLEVSDKTITLHERTFHPNTPGLAFMGLWGQIGPYLPVLEQQARYIAYTWADIVQVGDMKKGLEESRHTAKDDVYQHLQTLRFARLAGCDPAGQVSAELEEVLNKNAVTSISLRLVGTDALPEAEHCVREDARQFGRRDISD